VNVVVAHLFALGGKLGGGERDAHTIFEYGVPGTVFPPSAQYVALGHLHRCQAIPGPCPIRYPGSPLQLDFGETGDRKAVLVVEAAPGRPVEVREHALQAGRRLRDLEGTLPEVLAHAGATADDFLRVRLHEVPRVGLADEVREAFPECVDVQILRPDGGGAGPDRAADDRRTGDPAALYRAYLQDTRGGADEAVVALFQELLEEQPA
jgi:exonuclease SbcD